MLNSGLAVRMVRQAKRLNLSEVARKAEISTPFLSLVERGEREASLSVLRRIAVALDVPPEALILLSASPDSSLRSNDEKVQGLADSVRRLAEAEDKLRKVLGEDG